MLEDEKHALHKTRTFTGWYTHGLRNVKSLRQKIQSLGSIDQFLDEVERFFESLMGEPELAPAG